MTSQEPPKGRKARAIERAASLWLARLSLGTLDAEDRAAFDAWRAADPANEAAFERMAGALGRVEGAGDTLRAADRAARGAARQRSARRTGAALGLTAVALLALVATTDFAAEFADLRTGRAEQRTIALADGSQLTLDADAAVDIAYAADTRTIRLIRGRVHAQVRHGDPRPFRVAAAEGAVQDVGTGFDVALDPGDRVTTIVTDGIVLAGTRAGRVRLTRGQGGTWQGTGAPHRFLAATGAEGAPWRYGRLVFDGQPFDDVVRALDRYSRKPLWLWNSAAAERRVSGVVNAAALDASLPPLARAQGLRVRDIGVALVLY